MSTTPPQNSDSPLSVIASVSGILTFITALLAALYARISYLRTADTEYFRVKASLNWYKTESAFLRDLISPSSPSVSSSIIASGTETKARMKENEMYTFVLDQLRILEDRLLELIAEVEDSGSGEEKGKSWTFIPEAVRGRTDIAMKWMPVRGKAMDLVRQRDALGNRVLFALMSLVSSRVKDQENQSRERELKQDERMEMLKGMVGEQGEKLDKLEDLVYRLMHRNRVGVEDVEYQDSTLASSFDTNTTKEDGEKNVDIYSSSISSI